MRGSKEKNLMLNTSASNHNCFSSILKSFTCGANLPSPTPSDHPHIKPIFKSNGCIHPNPNELPTSTSSQFLLQDGNLEVGFGKDNPRQPGLVARLMGLESMPDHHDLPLSTDPGRVNLRSKSMNSLQLYIYPDTFLDHVSPSPSSISHHQRRKPNHRRSLTSAPSLCVKPSSLQEKVEPLASNADGGAAAKPEKRRRNVELDKRNKFDERGLALGRRKEVDECRNGRKKGFDNKVDASKCRASLDQRTRKRLNRRDNPKKEIKYTVLVTKSNKKRGSVDEPKRNHRHDSKDGTTHSRRRRSSRKATMDQQHDKADEGLLQDHIQDQNLRWEVAEDRKELMLQVIKLTEEDVRDDNWIGFDENVKELGVDFGTEMLEVLINQLLDDLLGK